MKPSKIFIRGHKGKVGSTLYHTLTQQNHCVIGMKRGPILNQLSQHKPDLIIDVTSALTIHEAMNEYLLTPIPVIIGTSGITPQQAIDYCQQSKSLYIVPNFSSEFQSFVAQALIRHQTQPIVKIEETHHQSKVDQPSGSALYLSHLFQAPIESFRVPNYIAQHTLIDQNTQYTHTIRCPSEFIKGTLNVINMALNHSNSGIIMPGY